MKLSYMDDSWWFHRYADRWFHTFETFRNSISIKVYLHLGVSKNWGTPKWMVKIMEIPIQNGWFGGTTIFGNTHLVSMFLFMSLYWLPFWATCFDICTLTTMSTCTFWQCPFGATKLCPVGAGNPSHWSSPKDFQGMYSFHASTRTFPDTTKPSCRITTNGESSCMALGGGALGHGYRWLGGYLWDECVMLKVMSNPNGVSRHVGIEVVSRLAWRVLFSFVYLALFNVCFLFLDWPALEYPREIYLKNGSHVSQSWKNCLTWVVVLIGSWSWKKQGSLVHNHSHGYIWM